ncbi:MAG: head GIN domain-containing protein [Saprospiraceae bacterium]
MKSFSILLAIAFLFCYTNCEAQWSKIKGEGPVVEQTLELDEFSSIGLGIAADVVLTQGPKQSVRVKGQQNIIDNIKTRVKGNSWNIGFDENASDYKELIIYITIPTLESLAIGGSGDITSTNHFDNLDDIKIAIGGSGDVSLDLDAKDVNVSIGGSGEVALKGSGDELNISIGGSGDISAFDFPVEECKVSSAGSGDIDVHVSEHLKVSLVGSGDVTYLGNPQVKSTVLGSGEVEKKN